MEKPCMKIVGLFQCLLSRSPSVREPSAAKGSPIYRQKVSLPLLTPARRGRTSLYDNGTGTEALKND